VKNASRARLSTARHDKEFASLRDLSARVVEICCLCRPATEYIHKLDGILWIKASGKWLAHAVQEEMFVPLELANVKASIQNDTKLRRPILRMTSCVHLLKRLCTPSFGMCCPFTCTRSTLLPGDSSRWARPADRALAAALAMDSVRSVRHTTRREIEKAVAGRPETEVLILGITDWSSVDRTAIQRKNFCVK